MFVVEDLNEVIKPSLLLKKISGGGFSPTLAAGMPQGWGGASHLFNLVPQNYCAKAFA